MPFIVSTKRPGAQAREVRDLDCIVVGRRAVATLEEAQQLATNLAGTAAEDEEFRWSCPESGGTVGPLPDGTLIEVEAAEYDELWREAGRPNIGTWDDYAKSAVLRVFNAKQAA